MVSLVGGRRGERKWRVTSDSSRQKKFTVERWAKRIGLRVVNQGGMGLCLLGGNGGVSGGSL